MKVREAWLESRKILECNGIQDYSIEAEVLLRHAIGIDRVKFFQSLNCDLSSSTKISFDDMIHRRSSREPLAYIVGSREFYGLDFIVNPHVLIPRQETELLVEEVLNFLSLYSLKNPLIADIGTGSGSIAISIAKNSEDSTIFAIDKSIDALKVANLNRHKHGVSDRVKLLHGHLLSPLSQKVDVIVSNPPYIASHIIGNLEPEVQNEPREALDGGYSGVDSINEIISSSTCILKSSGMIAIEINYDHSEEAKKLCHEYFPKAEISVIKDLTRTPRMVKIVLAKRLK